MPAFQSTYWLSAFERSETMHDIFKVTVEQIANSIQEAKNWKRGSSIYPVKIACVDSLIRLILYYDHFFIADKSAKINHVEKNNLVKVWRKLESAFLKTASNNQKKEYESIKRSIDADFVNRYLKKASQFQLRYARTNDIQLCELREKLLQCKSSETENVFSEKCPYVTLDVSKKRPVAKSTPSRSIAKAIGAKRIKRD
jgi:hypothetical protein